MAATAAIVAGGVAAGVGSAAGGIAAQPDKVKDKYSFYNPAKDQALAGLSLEAMIGLGLPPYMILEQASPINQIINAINLNPTITNSKKIKAIQALINVRAGDTPSSGTWQRGGATAKTTFTDITTFGGGSILGFGKKKPKLVYAENEVPWSDLKRALREVGMGPADLAGIIEQENAWREYTNQVYDKIGESQEDIFDARLGTQRSIASLMDDVSNQYGEVSSRPGQQVGSYMRTMEADINRTYDKQMEDVMRMANASGFNPGRAISDLEDSRASALGNLQTKGTIQAEQIIQLLQNSLAPAQATAQAAASARVGQSVSASGVAGNQASAINQIQANQNAQQAQALGAGISGAASSFGSGLTLAALLSGGPAAGTAAPAPNTFEAMRPEDFNSERLTDYGYDPAGLV